MLLFNLRLPVATLAALKAAAAADRRPTSTLARLLIEDWLAERRHLPQRGAKPAPRRDRGRHAALYAPQTEESQPEE